MPFPTIRKGEQPFTRPSPKDSIRLHLHPKLREFNESETCTGVFGRPYLHLRMENGFNSKTRL